MLAYVFWHRPKAGVEAAEYEDAQQAFQATLATPSACFRLAELPFATGGGYEDWYLVDDWAGIGELNDAAVDATRRGTHDQAASLAADGWGGVYELLQGAAEIPTGIEWLDKPRGTPLDEFIALLPHQGVWRRQLVLGPAPEFCCSRPETDARTSV
jgi:hypothetical protein